jgi:hypothetical protein
MLISRLRLHRVEALVRVGRSRQLDRWQRALLSLASTRVPCGGELITSLSDLQVDAQVLGQLVRELTVTGLLRRNGAGQWQMTPAGRHALESGAAVADVEERRAFIFVDNSALGRPPHFLPLNGARPPAEVGSARGADASRSEDHPFDPPLLEACVRQTPAWKARFRFPSEVEALVPPRPDESPAANWHSVILDIVEERPLVFIQTAKRSGAPVLSGFSVRAEGWALEPEPVLELAEGWEEALPDLAVEPSPEMWRQAWQAWTHPRGLLPGDVAACRLERVDHRLLVHAPPRLIERLRAARSDAIKQEAWLLAGDGRTRLAAQLELHPL